MNEFSTLKRSCNIFHKMGVGFFKAFKVLGGVLDEIEIQFGVDF